MLLVQAETTHVSTIIHNYSVAPQSLSYTYDLVVQCSTANHLHTPMIDSKIKLIV